MNKRASISFHRFAIVEEISQILIPVWCRLLYLLMRFNKFIKKTNYPATQLISKSQVIFIFEGATATCFG